MPAKKFGQRLMLTHTEAPGSPFWHSHWASGNLKEKLDKAYTSPSLSPYEKPFLKYLPKTGKILEAGCGYGPYVIALQKNGYEIEGIELSQELVKAVKSINPNMPVKCGDATAIDKPNEYYDGYVSLGVVEHRFEGPEPFLIEAHRILKKGGWLLYPFLFTITFGILKAEHSQFGILKIKMRSSFNGILREKNLFL